jgi:hypothetical protein
MKPWNKRFALITILLATVPAAWVLADTHAKNEYDIVAIKNCQIMMRKSMTPEQIDAYLALKKQEEKMHELELPIRDIEKDIQNYSTNIESLTKLAIQENEESLYIDQTLLKKQNSMSKEFNDFMSEHEHKFNALSKQGEVIAQYAESFKTTIQADLNDLKYDQLQITAADEPIVHGCNQYSKIILM